MQKKSVQRLNQIIKVLTSYGFGFIVDSKLNKEKNSPENLRKAFEELGSAFIKIGQILSTRPDILPEAYIKSLEKLQNNVLPEKYEDIEVIISKEFNKPIQDLFLHFDKTPLASASIAQAHMAVLKDGRHVIVKVQRPNIAEEIRLDLSILRKILNLTKIGFNDMIINPEDALKELSESTELELNFKNEQNNLKKFKELNKDVAFIYVPYIVDSLTSSKVITMEYIEGFKIDNLEMLSRGGYDLQDLGKKLTLSFFKQIFEDGFFHGDPHPGNIIINEGKICYIDFGIVGTLSNSLKASLNDIVLSIAYHDINKIVSVLISICIKNGYINRNELYEDVDYMFNIYLSSSLNNINISVLFNEILTITKKHNMRLPKEFTMLIRGTSIIEGVIAKICPDLKLIDIIIPYIKSNEKFSPFKNFSLNDFILNLVVFSKDASKIPTKINQVSDSLLSGRTKVQLQHTSLEKPIAELNKMVNRLLFGLVIAAMIIGSSTILSSNIGPKFYGVSIIGLLGFGFAGISGIWLIISIIRSGNLK